MPRDDVQPRPAASLRGRVYRQARLWHGWLSAFAFLALIFFAATGLLLNNPDWFEARPVPQARAVTLSAAELAAARAALDPDRALAEAVARRLALRGVYQPPRPGDRSGGRKGAPGALRLRGVTGSAEIILDRHTGQAQVKTETADFAAVITNLHKGKNAGPVWRLMIDAMAIVVLSLSLLGYVLFFAMRYRLRTALVLTALTLGGATAVFLFAVP